MPLKPNYCSQCGQSVVTRLVDGRPRAVCGACDQVFYENPLPVAAAVVLNARREVLLVKRKHEPQQGMWCLPMGFAELGESIAEAALRELNEETGVQGTVRWLLDADSLENSYYGDLLVVTFEADKRGGEERPGDDAEAVRYFPMTRHPPLAFSANDRALRAAQAAHQEEWQIQDSFVALQSSEEKGMLSDVLVELVEQHAQAVARLWLADVRSNSTTRSYHRLDPAQLLPLATGAVAHFGRWIKGDEGTVEVKVFYQALAGQRRAQGCPLHEVISALTLMRKHLWTFARSQGVWQRPVDVYRVLELNRRMAVFFDQAVYRVVRAFDGSPES